MAKSIVCAVVVLPLRSPAVITMRPVPPAPWPTKHLNEVCDCHRVFSHPVLSNRALLEKRTCPMLAPCTVIEADPVPARFFLGIVLIPVKSTEYAADMLPLFCTAVITVRRVPREPCPTKHRTDVSDHHSVASHLECPNLTMPENLTFPIDEPWTVTDAHPLPARFVLCDALKLDKSIQKTDDRLPPRCPADITTRRVPLAPCPRLHCTDVSDLHSVLSHLDCPRRTITVMATIPNPAPCTVTLAEPVPARFNRLNTLMLPRSTEYTALRLPEHSPPVMTTRRVPRVALPIRHLIDVSDRHAVASQFEMSTRSDTVRTDKPNPAPRMVTLVDPVTALFLRI